MVVSRIIAISLALCLWCEVGWAKWIIVDDTSTVQDIASHRHLLSRGYQFSGAKAVEVPNNLRMDLLDKWDGKKVIPYVGTEKQRVIDLLTYAISHMEGQILIAPTPKDRDEWQAVLDILIVEKAELTK